MKMMGSPGGSSVPREHNSAGCAMPRITFTVPILPGRQDEVVRLLAKYKKQLEGAHAAVDAVQWFIFVDRDEYVELIEWAGRSFVDVLRIYFATPGLADFFAEAGPLLLMPPVPEGEDAVDVIAAFLEGRSMVEAYALRPAVE